MQLSEESAKERVLSAIADEYSRMILAYTMDKPASALQVSKASGIPSTTLYRRIEELVEAGLIASVKTGRTVDGKWHDLYRSLLRRINVSFENGEVRIDVAINESVSDRFTKLWTSISLIEA